MSHFPRGPITQRQLRTGELEHGLADLVYKERLQEETVLAFRSTQTSGCSCVPIKLYSRKASYGPDLTQAVVCQPSEEKAGSTPLPLLQIPRLGAESLGSVPLPSGELGDSHVPAGGQLLAMDHQGSGGACTRSSFHFFIKRQDL